MNLSSSASFPNAIFWLSPLIYLYGCKCVSSCLTFDEISFHSIGMDMVGCQSELASELIK